MQWSFRALIFGSIFLLFPVAHLRPWPALPIYSAEILLLIALSLSASVWGREFARSVWRMPSSTLWGPALFVGGALLTFFIRELPLRTLGLFKSFVLLPAALFLSIASGPLPLREHQTILALWWLGSLASAVAGILALASGYVTYDGRLAAHFSSPNHLAMLLAPGVMTGSYLFSLTARRRLRYSIGLATALIALALLATRSYGVIMGAAVGILILILGSSGWRSLARPVGLLALLGLFALGVFFEAPTEKFQSLIHAGERSSLASRAMIWESGLAMAKDSFPWGIGIGQFQAVYLEYQQFFPPYLEWAVPEPHQLFLSWYLSAGLLGLAGVLWSLAQAVRKLWRVARYQSGDRAALAWCYLGLIGYWLLAGVLDTPYFKSDLALGFWGLLGLAWSLSAGVTEEETRG